MAHGYTDVEKVPSDEESILFKDQAPLLSEIGLEFEQSVDFSEIAKDLFSEFEHSSSGQFFMRQFEDTEQDPIDGDKPLSYPVIIKPEPNLACGDILLSDEQSEAITSTTLDVASLIESAKFEVVPSDDAQSKVLDVNLFHEKKKATKRKAVVKGTDEYLEKRRRNNIAVRKARDKAKHVQKETDQSVQKLKADNEELQRKVDLLMQELKTLKGLFTSAGANLPINIEKYIQ